MQTKIAFFDIDGTLIDMQSKRITEKTLEALQRLRAGGVKICLATGRSPVALPVFPGVEFDAYLTFNGSLCYTAGGETIFILRGVDGAKIAAWWDRAVDIIPASGGKGAGIGKILEYYGFDKAEAVAFGDGNNDIEMLQAVGDAVAMGNASDELKAVATEVCRPMTEDGVYWYCVENGLI